MKKYHFMVDDSHIQYDLVNLLILMDQSIMKKTTTIVKLIIIFVIVGWRDELIAIY